MLLWNTNEYELLFNSFCKHSSVLKTKYTIVFLTLVLFMHTEIYALRKKHQFKHRPIVKKQVGFISESYIFFVLETSLHSIKGTNINTM